MQTNQTDHLYRQSIVIGAGPVGLTAALALKNLGLEVAVLEGEPKDRQRPGSRAIYLHKATLGLIDDISPGLGYKLAENGVVWPVKRTLFRGKEVYVRNYGAPKTEGLPPFTSLPQVKAEKYLYEACVKAGIEFFYDKPVTDVKTSENGVEVFIGSDEVWKADYIIAADGGRSAVRQAIGVELEGPRTKDTFLVVDVIEDKENPLPLERIFHYQHPAMGGRNVMYVPFKGGWRVDLQLLDGDDPEEFSGKEGVQNWLPKVMDAKYADAITWVSTYTFHQAVSSSYTDENNRVLLAGEAAHLFAPFGARGLNSGVPDAIIAARGIKKAVDAGNLEEAKQAIADAANERRIAGLYNREGSNTALHHIQGSSSYMNRKKEVAASLSTIVPSIGRWLDEGPYGPRSGPPELTTKY
ncbi:FAD-dependent monooxygenase [Peribacillus sp. NPDC096540]|uniref:FAD-dependent monooxygenase n=1 Tax=Peribacillus sp. NPDC096540 TaxID=3390612 RepID=UPI003D055B1A